MRIIIPSSCAFRVTNVGGNADNGAQSSVFTLNANNVSSNRNRNIGRQLAGSRAYNLDAHEFVAHKELGSFGEQLGHTPRFLS
jgi:hypothetical protein